jgi:hypothetical protein
LFSRPESSLAARLQRPEGRLSEGAMDSSEWDHRARHQRAVWRISPSSRFDHRNPKGRMNLEQTLEKVIESAREELHIVRKRAEEKTPARDHGKDYHEAQSAADRLDHYAHQLHRLHDSEYQDGWRHMSASDRE